MNLELGILYLNIVGFVSDLNQSHEKNMFLKTFRKYSNENKHNLAMSHECKSNDRRNITQSGKRMYTIAISIAAASSSTKTPNNSLTHMLNSSIFKVSKIV